MINEDAPDVLGPDQDLQRILPVLHLLLNRQLCHSQHCFYLLAELIAGITVHTA